MMMTVMVIFVNADDLLTPGSLHWLLQAPTKKAEVRRHYHIVLVCISVANKNENVIRMIFIINPATRGLFFCFDWLEDYNLAKASSSFLYIHLSVFKNTTVQNSTIQKPFNVFLRCFLELLIYHLYGRQLFVGSHCLIKCFPVFFQLYLQVL